MPIQQILGYSGAHTTSLVANYHCASGFSAGADAVATEYRFVSASTGNGRVQVYSGSAWASASLVYEDSVGHSAIPGEQIVTIPGIQISSGTTYWLGMISDTAGVFRYSTPGGNFYFKAQSYAGFSPPNPPGSGYTAAGTNPVVYLYGWLPPTVVSCDADPVTHGATVGITGTNFMGSGLVVELCDNADRDLANVIVPQSVSAHDDTSASFTANVSGLGATAYVIVTTTLDQRNTGYVVNVTPYEPPSGGVLRPDGCIGDGCILDGFTGRL